MTGFTVEINGPGLDEPVQIHTNSLEQLNDRSAFSINYVEGVLKAHGASDMCDLSEYQVDVMNDEGEILVSMDLGRFAVDQIAEHPSGEGYVTLIDAVKTFDNSPEMNAAIEQAEADITKRVCESANSDSGILKGLGAAKFDWMGGP